MNKSSCWSSFFRLLLLLATAALSANLAYGQTTRVGADGESAFRGDIPTYKATFPKVSGDLLVLEEEFLLFQSLQSAAGDPDPFTPSIKLMHVWNNYVTVDAIASGDIAALEAELLGIGAIDIASYNRTVSARVPITSLRGMQKLDSLRFVRPFFATTRVGATTSQGDVAQESDDLRTNAMVDGTGITIGVMSDSYDCLGGAAAGIASGDLPAGGVTVVEEFAGCPNASDEGRGMLEIVHDVAPGADKQFHTAFGGTANFASGIGDLVAAGSDVIVDDVFYFSEPMFLDGDVAIAANAAVAGGVPYYSSAGNAAQQSYEGQYSDSGLPGPFGGQTHDFDPTDAVSNLFSLFVPVGAGFQSTFQWNESFASVAGPGAVTDVDIFVLGADGITVLGASTSNNIASGDPLEILVFNNTGFDLDGVPGNDTTFFILIEHFAGPKPDEMKWSFSGSGISITSPFDTDSGTSFGHSSAAGASGVAAARYSNTPAFGQNPPIPEAFTSSANVPIHFNAAGNPIVPPLLRLKPDIMAPDGANTTFFGSPDSDNPPDGFPNFFGTSAAAPHAAGVAALLLDIDGSLLPADINSALENSTIDSGDPGFDFTTGFGLIDAVSANAALANDPPALDPIAGAISSTGDGPVSLGLNAVDPNMDNITLTATGLPSFCALTDNGNGTGSVDCTVTAIDFGRMAVVITATDDGTPARSHSQGFYFIANPNTPPTMAAIGNPVINDGDVLNIPLSANDPEGTTVFFGSIGLPLFCSITDNGNSTGSLDCTPGFNNTGVYVFGVVANDNGQPVLNDGETVILTVNNVNRDPVLNPIAPVADMTENVQSIINFSATDLDIPDALSFSATGVPPFCVLNDNGNGTGNLTCNPTFADAGTYNNVMVTVTDAFTATDDETFSFNVIDANQPPILDFIGNQAVANTDVLVINLTSSDADGDNLALSDGGLPGFCVPNYTGATGTITCTPGGGNNGNYPITVTVTDDGTGNLTDDESFTVNVGDPGNVNNYPVLDPIGNQQADDTSQLVVNLNANDVDGDTLTLASFGEPAFCAFTDNGNGTGDITCNPVFGDAGTYPVEVRVTDDGTPNLADNEMIEIEIVHLNLAPIANAGPDQEVAPLTLVNLDGTGSTDLETMNLQFSWEFSSIPAGSAVTNGSIAGAATSTPSFTPDIDGFFDLLLTVTDDDLATDTDRVRIHSNTPSDLYFGDAINPVVARRSLPSGVLASNNVVSLAGFTVVSTRAIATHPFTNVMYAALELLGQPGSYQLVTIADPSTNPAIATSVGNLGEQIVGMTFDPAGKLLGVTANTSATPDALMRINPETAALTFMQQFNTSIDALGIPAQGLSYDTNTRTLYHAYTSVTATATFESVDTDAGTTTVIPYSGDVTNLFDTDGLAFDRLNDRFVGPMENFNTGLREFFSVTPAGAVTTITSGLINQVWRDATFWDPNFQAPAFTYEDSNGDGKADIVWREGASGQNWIYLMDGTQIELTGPINTVSNLNYRIVGRGDYNGDGKADILWREIASGQVWMYLMDGQVILCSVPVAIVSNLNWTIVGNGDYNGDNRSDVLWYNTATGQVWLWTMNGDLISTSNAITVVGNLDWTIVGNRDYDGDGDCDILWYNTATGTVWVWLMQNGGINTSTGIATVGNLSWTIVGSGDFNNDNRADILWYNTATGQVWIWFMDVGGTTVQNGLGVVTVGNLNWTIIGIGDYDCDGDADIIWRENTAGHYQMWLMNGNVIQSNVRFTNDGNLNWSPVFVD